MSDTVGNGSDGTNNHYQLGGVIVEQTNTVGGIVNHAAGGWWKASQAGTVSAATPTASTMYLMPLWFNRVGQISKLAIEITTQGISPAGTDVMRLGVYNAARINGAPTGAALADFGTIDLEGAAAVTVLSGLSLTLAPKLYWLAVVRQTTGTVATPAQVRSQVGSTNNYSMIRQAGLGTPAIGTDGASYGYYTQGSVTGALPTIGALANSSVAAPVVLINIVS